MTGQEPSAREPEPNRGEPDATLAARWLAQGTPAVVVEVVSVRGSAPREPGARMLVSAQASHGTIGGGHLEWQAIARARRTLAAHADADERLEDWTVALGPSLGQCCGGAVTLRFSRLTAECVNTWPAATPLFTLHLFGAGHVGASLVQVLAAVPCAVRWIDGRPDVFPTALPAHVDTVCCDDDPAAETAWGRAGDFYLAMTHSHALDLAVVEAVLRRGDFGWCGVIGSATKRARFLHLLHARGVRAEALSRLVCPIGVPGVEGKAPGVVAVATAAQLLGTAASRHAALAPERDAADCAVR